MFNSRFLRTFKKDFVVRRRDKGEKEEADTEEEEEEEDSEEESEEEYRFDYYDYCNDGNVIYLYDQVFEDIRAECIKKKKLFRDTKFPTSKTSFYKDYDEMKPRVVYTWLRPGEISDKPLLVAGGASRFDTKQGAIGNCWFVSAVCNFALLQEKAKGMFTKVVPEDQSFEENYAGIFHFRFWQYGDWIDVVVDDRLPTKYGQLACLSSMDGDEYWAALLEKAYAKLHGSYEVLTLGDGSEAFVDLTGALSELYQAPYPENLYEEMLSAYEKNAFIGCIYPQTEAASESVTDEGLVTNHYYSVTAVKVISYQFLGDKGNARMVRVRNPWANATEWSGAGSDGSVEWNFIPKEMKDSLELKVEDDGEFWMPFKDFCEKFDRIEICPMPPHEEDSSWSVQSVHGLWPQASEPVDVEGFKDDDDALIMSVLSTKPQHLLIVENDDTTVIVQLIEKNRRRNRLDDQTIQIFVFHCPEHRQRLGDKYLANDDHLIAKKSNYGRDISCEVTLDAGRYMVIPANADCDNGREYYMRMIYNNTIDVTFECAEESE